MYSDYSTIVIEVEDGLCTLTLNRPELRNAISRKMLDELNDFLAKAKDAPGVRALVITGAGEKAFSSGADLKEWGEKNKKRAELGTMDLPEDAEGGNWVVKGHAMMLALKEFPKPVIAAVNGVAVGAGCDMALAADFRFGSSNARFGEAYIKIGFCPDNGGTYLLPRIVGEPKATEMILTGDIVEAEEAYRIGILNRLTTPENLMAEAKEFAGRLAKGPTVAIGQAKLLLNKNRLVDFRTALNQELEGGKICRVTEDSKEAIKAFNEKRKPVFKGC